MFGSKRNVRIVLAGLTLALLVAGWTAMALAATPVATPAVTAPAETGTPVAPTETTTPAAEVAPAGAAPTIPHPVAGRENCLACHVEAKAGGAGAPGGAGPAVPHELGGREKCNTCHAVGTGAVPAPADHEGRAEDLCVSCHTSASGEAATLPPLPQQASTEFCLPCHGPFEALAALTKDRIEIEGVKANPHVYTPHDSKNITGCDACHGVHELPVTATTAFAPADTDSCFAACHHERDFTPCSDCHDE